MCIRDSLQHRQCARAASHARLRAKQGGKVANIILAPGRIGDGQPFMTGLECGRLAHRIIAFVGLVVLRAVLPAVVRDFVIVDLRNHRE